MRWMGVFMLAVLVVAPLAQSHTAPAPRGFESRLLHDCNDDWFGGDTGIGERPGYDLHALDVREAWSEALGEHVIFRIILNGEGQSTFTLTMKAGGASKSYQWSGSGSSWQGTFDQVQYVGDIGDGDRFALEGAVKRADLGAVGTKLTEYKVSGTNGGSTHDSMPGNDATLGACEDNFQRPDYRLAGPVQYVEARLEQTDVSAGSGEEVLVALELENRLRDMAQAVTIRLAGDTGVVRLHEPGSGVYVTQSTIDLNKKGAAGDASLIHVAVESDVAASGTVTIEITTNRGGRIVETLDYTITAGTPAPSTPSTPSEPEPPGEDSPFPAVLVFAALAWAVRRR